MSLMPRWPEEYLSYDHRCEALFYNCIYLLRTTCVRLGDCVTECQRVTARQGSPLAQVISQARWLGHRMPESRIVNTRTVQGGECLQHTVCAKAKRWITMPRRPGVTPGRLASHPWWEDTGQGDSCNKSIEYSYIVFDWLWTGRKEVRSTSE